MYMNWQKVVNGIHTNYALCYLQSKLAHIFLCAAQVFILKLFAKNIIYFCLSPGWATLH